MSVENKDKLRYYTRSAEIITRSYTPQDMSSVPQDTSSTPQDISRVPKDTTRREPEMTVDIIFLGNHHAAGHKLSGVATPAGLNYLAPLGVKEFLCLREDSQDKNQSTMQSSSL